MNWIFLNTMVATAIISWWLSGFDTGLSGHDDRKRADFIRRVVRCGVTMLLVALCAGGSMVFMIVVAVPIAAIWVGCLSELFARGFNHLIDSDDKREFDPKHIERELDRLAGLVQNDRNQEAVELCRHLQESGDASGLAMETMLFRLFERMYSDERIATSPGLEEAWKLRGEGRFAEAESNLNPLLNQNPDNLAAALLLMRICAQDLNRPDKAQALLQALGQRPHVPPGFIGYARRRVGEWSGAVPQRQKTIEGIESLLVERKQFQPPETTRNAKKASVDELLADGRLATAIELLEAQLATQPGNFDLWLKLAEAHGVYCRDPCRAGKIVRKIECNAAFTPEQIHLARAKLREWQAASRT